MHEYYDIQAARAIGEDIKRYMKDNEMTLADFAADNHDALGMTISSAQSYLSIIRNGFLYGSYGNSYKPSNADKKLQLLANALALLGLQTDDPLIRKIHDFDRSFKFPADVPVVPGIEHIVSAFDCNLETAIGIRGTMLQTQR
ncbi:hypothetical protein H6503_05580 [Candidatus Woesearchaeota archaeon]|nr:hypothetical protein [Candidatus Woesearchaeota archaeon]